MDKVLKDFLNVKNWIHVSTYKVVEGKLEYVET